MFGAFTQLLQANSLVIPTNALFYNLCVQFFTQLLHVSTLLSHLVQEAVSKISLKGIYVLVSAVLRWRDNSAKICNRYVQDRNHEL